MLKKARKYINDRVDWEAGNGMLMLMLVLLLLIIYTFAVVVEIGGWYYTAAVVQTKTDAIIEGAAVMADTGYVAADEIDPAKPGIYKSMTEIDNEAASEQAYELYMANLANLPNIVEDFKYVHNTDAALGDTAKLDYNQRVYTGIGTASATNFFNLLERSQYKMSANGKVKVVGVELPLEDTTRFAEMYPDDPRIPISALTNNTGDTMANTFEFISGTEGTGKKGNLITDKDDNRSAALYAAVLDQFKLDLTGEYTGSARYMKSTYSSEYKIYHDEYVYENNNNTIALSPSSTLLWDISVAMDSEVPRYQKKSTATASKQSSYYEWYKGRKNVQLSEIDIYDTNYFTSVSDVGAAVNLANDGKIVFAVSGDTYYFIRPTDTDSSGNVSSSTTSKLACAYTDGVNGSNNILVDISGMPIIAVKD